jgi:hypothetical protein
MLKKTSWLPLVGVILMALNSCSSNEEPYLVVQTCIEDDRAFVATFPSRIAGVAARYGLTVVDHSAETEQQLEDIKASGNVNGAVSQTINLGLARGDRVEVMIGNLGLSRHEVLISFFGSPRDKVDHDLSGAVVGALKQHWPVETVPAGKGAFPMESCKNLVPNASEGPQTSKAG